MTSLWAGEVGQGSLSYGLTSGLPLHVFVVCCWGGKVVPFRAWSKSSLTLISLLWMPFIISSCCNLGERVCSCLLLLGWKGCRLVYLFAVARVQGLAQALFRRLGSSAPPPFTSLTSPSWRIMGGGSACSSANLGAKYLQKIMFSPLYAVFSISCHYFLCNLPLPLFLQGWKGCLLTTGVVSIYLIVVDGKQWALKGRLGKVLSAMALPLRSFKHVLHFSFPVLVFVCSRWVGRVVQQGAWSKSSLTLYSLHWLSFSFCLSLSLSPIDFIWVNGLALEGRFGKGSLGYGLTFGLPLHVFVCCCWGGRVAPLRAWSKSSLTWFSLLRLSSLSPLVVICANGFVVVCCWWGGMVVVLCACLLLPVGGLSLQEGRGKSLTVSGSLSSDLLIMHGWEGWLRLFSEVWALVPPRFLHFSHFSCLASVYLFVDGVEACALQPI